MLASLVVPQRRLDALSQPAFRDLLDQRLIGLEKETLRVTAGHSVANTPHPPGLGSALTHPFITTDFSEALLELVTPALPRSQQVLDLLRDLHLFVYRNIDDELLWATSMPCVVSDEQDIPLAHYGESNAARMKTVYRRGLGHRYGRIMQIIAGVHFNFSLPDSFWPAYAQVESGVPAQDLRSATYMGLVRNLQRFGWLVPYLFGASPAVCSRFVQDPDTDLETFDETTLYYPYATSLRMGDIGYQNRQEEGVGIKASYDSLDAYVRSLSWAIQTPSPDYRDIGVKVGDQYEQLNDHILQIENEYYSTVRPKQLTDWMERPTLALHRRGIRYVELRSVDVNAFHPLGIDLEQMRFLTSLMLYCLLLESPRINARERRAIDHNEVLAAHRGREPGLQLDRPSGPIELRVWAAQILEEMQPVVELLDDVIAKSGEGPDPNRPHTRALEAQRVKLRDPEATPSARMLAEMRENGECFSAFARRLSEQHRGYFRSQALDPQREAWLRELARTSLDQQRVVEAADDCDFDEFLRRYQAQSEAHPVELRSPFG